MPPLRLGLLTSTLEKNTDGLRAAAGEGGADVGLLGCCCLGCGMFGASAFANGLVRGVYGGRSGPAGL